MTTSYGDRQHYRWRQMTEAQRTATMAHRREYRLPQHSPPHYDSESGLYLVTAACFEHHSIIGQSMERLAAFEKSLLETCVSCDWSVFAWIVLPNHYHLLLRSGDAKALVGSLGLLHGRTSYEWNREEDHRGRKVWFNAVETGIKSERHFWAALLYVLNNAVKHRYVERWQDWPFSNACEWLMSVGREQALRIWKEYPIADFGREWDPPDL